MAIKKIIDQTVSDLQRLTYTPRTQFLEFHNRPHRWAVVCTHRRAGKTVALINDLILGARAVPLRRPNLAYIGPTFTQAKRVAWQYLKDYTKHLWSRPPSESEMKVTIKNDYGDASTIFCLGADNPDSLRGIYLDAAVLDEYALFRPSVFTQIIRPALSDRNGWAVFASTPRGRNLFYDEYKTALRSPDTHHVTYLPASTSGIIPASELEELRKHMDAEEFAQEYLCSFDSALKGAIYAAEVNQMFADGRAPTDAPLFDPALDTHFVYDLGFTDNTVRIAFQYSTDGYLNIVNVEATHGTDISYHIDSLHNFAEQARASNGAGIGEVFLPPDAVAKNLQTGKSIVEQFLAHGIRPRMVPKHNVRDGISAVRKLFPAVRIDYSLLPNSDVPVTGDLIEALKAYQREWDENNLVFSEKPLHNWASDYADAFRYMAMMVTPELLPRLRSSDMTRVVPPSPYEIPGMTLTGLFEAHEALKAQGFRRMR